MRIQMSDASSRQDGPDNYAYGFHADGSQYYAWSSNGSGWDKGSDFTVRISAVR